MTDIAGGQKGKVVLKDGILYAWNGEAWVVVSLEDLDASELGVINEVTAGVQAALKAVIADANVNTGVSKVTELWIGATGVEVKVDATPAEIDAALSGNTAVAAELSQLAGTFAALSPGKVAQSHIDFNAVGTAAMTVTIGAVVYQEADAEDFPNGVWTNGASAADSAVSLAAAINGDTRAAVPFTATADVSGDGLWLSYDAVGDNTLDIVSSTGDATDRAFNGGVAAAVNNSVQVEHLVTTNELLAGAIVIPLPFTPTTFSVQVRTTAGVMVASTDQFTIVGDTILCTVAGGTNVADTDTITVNASE